MARNEQSREDLLRDARQLTERIALRATASDSQEVLIGFRRCGSASVFFGEDPAFHFDAHSRLRRGFVDGELLKAERGRLTVMRRSREAGEVLLISRVLSEQQQLEFLARTTAWFRGLACSLEAGEPMVRGQAPVDGEVLARSLKWLRELLSHPIAVADRPGLAS